MDSNKTLLQCTLVATHQYYISEHIIVTWCQFSTPATQEATEKNQTSQTLHQCHGGPGMIISEQEAARES